MGHRLSKRLGNSVRDFAEHTSAHGIPRAFTSHGLRKALWLLLFFVCLVAFFAQAIQIVQRFARNDIIVGVELKFENIPFPSVTVCNLNPYKNSLARAMGSVRDTLVAFDDAIEKSDQGNQRSRRSAAQQNFQQKAQELYQKMNKPSGYEGLLAAYSFCNCPANQPDCTALKATDRNETKRIEGGRLGEHKRRHLRLLLQLEKRQHLALRSTRQLRVHGQAGGRAVCPCLCVPKIRFVCFRSALINLRQDCAFESKRSRPKRASSIWTTAAGTADEEGGGGGGQKNSTEFRLDKRLLKVWQITTTAAPIPLDEELADKEAAYGLKACAGE
ncbi:Degenerin-like protein asic-1 [Aphelenchoides fujianensis]|nr:Degenerin-like protein asic-1 [Aphelenchoides fujianensis]